MGHWLTQVHESRLFETPVELDALDVRRGPNTSLLLDAAAVEAIHRKLIDKITDDCQTYDLAFSHTYFAEWALKNLPASLHRRTGTNFANYLEEVLPKYADFQSWRIGAILNFMTTSMVELVPGSLNRYQLNISKSRPLGAGAA